MARVDDSVLRDGEEWMDPSDTRQRRQQVGVRGWRGDTERFDDFVAQAARHMERHCLRESHGGRAGLERR